MTTNNYATSLAEIGTRLNALKAIDLLDDKIEDCLHNLLGIPQEQHQDFLGGLYNPPSCINYLVELLTLTPLGKLLTFACPRIVCKELSVEAISHSMVKAWEAITQTTLDKPKGIETHRLGQNINVRSINERLRYLTGYKTAAAEHGTNALLLAILINEALERYSAELHLSNSESAAAAYIEISQHLFATRPIEKATRQFAAMAERAIRHYSIDAKIDNRLLGAEGAALYAYATHDFNSLQKFTVAAGGQIESARTLQMQEQVFIFDSTDDLVKRCSILPNGFTMNLVRPARHSDSFFAVVMKNGDSVVMLHDKPETSEFTKEAYSLRNDRYNILRHEESRFPYYAMKMKHDGKHMRSEIGTQLVTSSGQLPVLCRFSDLMPETILWFTFLIENCRNELTEQTTPQLPVLAYVGESSLPDHPLLIGNDAKAESLPAVFAADPIIEVKTAKQLSRENFLKSNPDAARFGTKNQWMEEMFDERIDSDLLYIPSTSNAPIALESKAGGFSVTEKTLEQTDGLELLKMPSTMLGTKEQVQAEADLHARANKAKLITSMLKEDFEQNADKVEALLVKMVKANMPRLLDELVALNHDYFRLHNKYAAMVEDGTVPSSRKMYRQIHAKKFRGFFSSHANMKRTKLHTALGVRDEHSTEALCFGSKDYGADVMLYLNIQTIHDLEIITGKSRNELPVQLRNWGLQTHNEARSAIQDGYDPVEAIKNPWDNFFFGFSIPVSKEFILTRRKELGVKGRFVIPKDYWVDRTEMERYILRDDVAALFGRGNLVTDGSRVPPHFSYKTESW